MNENPDVPLREPLDFDHRINRKMAKQIYEQEKANKIKENKEKLKHMKEKSLNDLVSGYEKKEKKFEKEKKALEEVKLNKI